MKWIRRSDGEEALEYAKTAIYDLMILDVMMPKLSGLVR